MFCIIVISKLLFYVLYIIPTLYANEKDDSLAKS